MISVGGIHVFGLLKSIDADLDAVFTHPQVQARGLKIELDGLPGVRSPFNSSDAELALHSASPRHGEHQPD